MKKIVITLLITLPSLCFAQSFTAVGFSELKNDLKARTEEVQDINGNPCALIRVALPVSDVSFDGWVNKQTAGKGEYLVYVAEGAKRITLRHASHNPFVYNIPTKVIGKHTYQLTIKTDGVSGSREEHENAILEHDRDLIQQFLEQLRMAYQIKDTNFIKIFYGENQNTKIISGFIVHTKSDIHVEYRKMTPHQRLSTIEKMFNRNEYVSVKSGDFEIFRDATNRGCYGVCYTLDWKTDHYRDKCYYYQLWDFNDDNHPRILWEVAIPMTDKIKNYRQEVPHPTYLDYIEETFKK